MAMGSLPKTNHPMPVALVFLRDISSGKVLFIKRDKEPFLDHWGLPGGRIETFEHPRDAAIRELYEETGVRVDAVNLRAVVSEVFQECGENAFHTLIFLFEAKQKVGEPGVGAKKSALFTLGEIDTLRPEIISSDYAFIREILIPGEGGVYESLIDRSRGDRLVSLTKESDFAGD